MRSPSTHSSIPLILEFGSRSPLFAIVFMNTVLPTADILEDESSAGFAEGGEIRFVEDFVLARDRTKAIEQLIPGTEDYYFYQCLHLAKYPTVRRKSTSY